jgi:hypothetical protein
VRAAADADAIGVSVCVCVCVCVCIAGIRCNGIRSDIAGRSAARRDDTRSTRAGAADVFAALTHQVNEAK